MTVQAQEDKRYQDLGQIPIPESTYRADLDLLDRYIGFSAEIVRVALLGLAALGFYLKEFVANQHVQDSPPSWFSGSVAFAAAMFAGAAACGLLHRYYSSDGMHYHLKVLRLGQRNATIDSSLAAAAATSRNMRYELGRRWLLSSECAVVAATAAVAHSFVIRFAVSKLVAPYVAVVVISAITAACAAPAIRGWYRFFVAQQEARTGRKFLGSWSRL